jgi:capsular polysaccharide export protein
VFAALAQADGGGRRLPMVPWSWRGFPETEGRVAHCLARAKRQPRGVGHWLKAWLIRVQYNGARRMFARRPGVVAVAWSGLGGSRLAFLLAARDAGVATLACELAPLPGRITVDPRGVNAESSVPRDAGYFVHWAGGDPARSGEGWRVSGQGLTARASRRADVGQGTATLPDGPFLFCPLQVPSDSQVTLFAGWTGGMAGFLAALGQAAAHLPEGWHLRVKEHPSARQSLAGVLAGLVASGRVVVDNAGDSFAQVAASRGVVTLNSSMGLQAFFYDKPVVVLGEAFFKQPGLVVPVEGQAELNAAFAGAEGLGFDPQARARFMNWLDQVYYPRFQWPGGQADLSAMAEKLRAARELAGKPVSGLSPPPLMR